MANVKVYSTQTCPKCKVLKEFLDKLGVAYDECDMGDPENMLHLMTYDGWPVDAAAPTLELIDPDRYEYPLCYTHYSLFSRGTLQCSKIVTILGIDPQMVNGL